ncbi:hypothetical protein C6P74_05465 [Burkholderia multivorans]|uniref:Uncharacterized protein n=1 Tax=Burkholderia multivorans TaxID=87883 RepID=A0AB37ASS2_9BURK|nr:hypothetical protein C6P74_05465 [Burkholderia multivorans]PRE46617.1 hypothetical protein C6P99_17165 [Burkholderia multivorans]PRE83177.1 hypothetical protein C6Q02_16255 [Burkholderia multivorans]
MRNAACSRDRGRIANTEGDTAVQLETACRAGIVLGAGDASHRIDAAARGPAPGPRLRARACRASAGAASPRRTSTCASA